MQTPGSDSRLEPSQRFTAKINSQITMKGKNPVKAFNKVVRLGQIDLGYKERKQLADIFCKIELSEDGRLSISGVEGPLSNGDARGSCGQIDMHLREKQGDIIPAGEWNAEKLKRFFEIWQEWHLNGMRPGCPHQTGPEWESKDVTIYYFRTKPEVYEAIRAAKHRAQECIGKGETFTPTAEETRLAKLADKITSNKATLPPELAKDYTANGPQYTNDHYNRPSEVKKTNWLNQSEHPEGFLSKPCPVCGYKYGNSWLKVEVPSDVISFLQSLPETDKTPAWV